MLENGVEINLNGWQKSDAFTKSVEQIVANEGINNNATLTEKDIVKISSDATIKTIKKNELF